MKILVEENGILFRNLKGEILKLSILEIKKVTFEDEKQNKDSD